MTIKLPGSMGPFSQRLGEAIHEATRLAQPLARQWVEHSARPSPFGGGWGARTAMGGMAPRGRVDVGLLAQTLGRMTLSTGAQHMLGAVLGRHGGIAGAAGIRFEPYSVGVPPGPFASPWSGFRPFAPHAYAPHAYAPHAYGHPAGEPQAHAHAHPAYGPQGQAAFHPRPFTPPPFTSPPFTPPPFTQQPFTQQPFTPPPFVPRPSPQPHFTPPRPAASDRPSFQARPAPASRPSPSARPAFEAEAAPAAPTGPAPLHAGSTAQEKRVAGLHFMGLKPEANAMQILGVSSDVTSAGLRKAYLQKQLRFHPDKNRGSLEAHEATTLIGNAYSLLSKRLETRGRL